MAGSDAQVLDLAGREVRITSPDKVLFSERGETKLDLVRYYAAVEEPLMRAMGGRPVLMQRFPKGAGGPSFFQKRVPDGAPEWLQTTTVQTVNGTPSRALVAADVAHVAWAVNLACLGFHVWPNRADDDEHADELRLDLDPQPGTGFAEAREAARELKALLDELGIAGFPKTTGNRGLHVYVRLAPRWDSYAVRSAAVAAARELERRRPDILTAAWWKEERGRRIFIDYNQNAPHKTVFGAWSVRARAGAQVSTPIRWEELDDVAPDELTLASVPARVERDGDPWAEIDARTPDARAAAGAARARPRERPARCAVAAGLPQAARRAAAGGAEPRPRAGVTGEAGRSGGERQHLLDRAAQRAHRRRGAARHPQDEHDRPVALEPDQAPERAGGAGQRGALPSLQRVTVLEQPLEQERRPPRMDGQLRGAWPPATAASARGRRRAARPVDGARRAARSRRPTSANASRAALPRPQPRSSPARSSMPAPVRSTSMAARSAPSSSSEATSMPSREACASAAREAQLADQVATQPRARGSARGPARPGRAPSSASASPARTRVSSGAPQRASAASSACATAATRPCAGCCSAATAARPRAASRVRVDRAQRELPRRAVGRDRPAPPARSRARGRRSRPPPGPRRARAARRGGGSPAATSARDRSTRG